RGGRLMACCPFHDDSNPSLAVDEDQQIFVCYGCHAKGSVIDAWALFEGVTVKEAFTQIEAHLGVKKSPAPATKPVQEKATPPSPEKKLVKTYDYRDED